MIDPQCPVCFGGSIITGAVPLMRMDTITLLRASSSRYLSNRGRGVMPEPSEKEILNRVYEIWERER
jgi:hypothetical protein